MAEDNPTQAAEDAIDRVASEKTAERAQEIQTEADVRVTRAQEAAKQEAFEARLSALESHGGTTAPDSVAAIESALGGAISPIIERLDRLEGTRQEASIQAQAKPTTESNPFTPQIDYAAIAQKSVEKMPRIAHPLFRRMLGRR